MTITQFWYTIDDDTDDRRKCGCSFACVPLAPDDAVRQWRAERCAEEAASEWCSDNDEYPDEMLVTLYAAADGPEFAKVRVIVEREPHFYGTAES